MKLTIETKCPDGDCPAIYATDRGTVVFQGSLVADAEAVGARPTATGETRAELPLELVMSWLHERTA